MRTMGTSNLKAAAILAALALPLPAAAQERSGLWTGIHIGLAAGYGQGNADYAHKNVNFFGGPGGTYANDVDGAIVGLQGGYDHQIGSLVLGLEGSFLTGPEGSFDFTQYSNDTTTNVHGLGAIAGRLGYAHDRWLPYVKGGFAWADVEAGQDYYGTPSRTWSKDGWLTGYAVGGGLEAMLIKGNGGQGISVGIEYLHYEFGAHLYDGPDSLKPVGIPTQIEGDLSLDTITAKASLRF